MTMFVSEFIWMILCSNSLQAFETKRVTLGSTYWRRICLTLEKGKTEQSFKLFYIIILPITIWVEFEDITCTESADIAGDLSLASFAALLVVLWWNDRIGGSLAFL